MELRNRLLLSGTKRHLFSAATMRGHKVTSALNLICKNASDGSVWGLCNPNCTEGMIDVSKVYSGIEALGLELNLASNCIMTGTKRETELDGPRRSKIGKLEENFSLLDYVSGPLSVDSCISTIQKCGKQKHLAYAKFIYANVCTSAPQAHDNIGNHIVAMFVNCGGMVHAQKAFNFLNNPNERSWTSLILGYVECGQPQHALSLYHEMEEHGMHPTSYTLTALLRACSRLKSMQKGWQIHLDIKAKELEQDLFVGSALVDMYAKCGSLPEARKALANLAARNVVSWTTLIAGNADHEFCCEAIECLWQMQKECVIPNAVTFVSVLKGCARIGAIVEGRKIHAEIANKGLERDHFIASSLVDMYAKCGSLREAQGVFDSLLVRDVAVWSALISGYVDGGFGQEALECFAQMQLGGQSPDAIMFLCIVRACSSIGDIQKARETHFYIAQAGHERDTFVGSALIDMYAKCGSMIEAQNVFDRLPDRDAVSWTTLISGYVENELAEEALKHFWWMELDDVPPDAAAYVCCLKACCILGGLENGRAVHSQIAQKSLDRDLLIGNALVDMYAKSGALGEAREVFEKMPVRDVVSWSTIIAGYAENGPGLEAVKCFDRMLEGGVFPVTAVIVSTLKACGSIGAIKKGRSIHIASRQRGMEKDISVGNALVDMYARCGFLTESWKAFNDLQFRDVISWNSMIKGYGINHEGNLALRCFDGMQEQGIGPDSVTFTCLLTACSRASLVLKGWEYFKTMKDRYAIAPTLDHYTCMVDLLARSGHLYEAEKLVNTAPCPQPKETWTALLSACKTYGDTELAIKCFKQLVDTNPENAASYVTMANIYASASKWEHASRIEELRKRAGARKKVARALIEIENDVHEFVVGENQSIDTLATLKTLCANLKVQGYVPNLDFFVKSMPDKEKEAALCGHAERLAIAFGMLHMPQGQALYVTKNLRMCNDCHNATKLISRIGRREIILRESNWVHHFENGLCSCGDMW